MLISEEEKRLLSDMQKAFPDLFANIEPGNIIGSYDEVLNAVNTVANEKWLDSDFSRAIHKLLDIGFFHRLFDLDTRKLKDDNYKHEMVLVFSDSASKVLASITQND